MSQTIKNILMIVIKNALNAVLTSAFLMQTMSGIFNIHTTDGWWNLGKAIFSVIMAREGAVWIPVILNWTKTNADPSINQKPTPVPEVK